MAERAERQGRSQVNVSLPADMLAEIDTRAAKRSVSRSKWIEQAIMFSLAQNSAGTFTSTVTYMKVTQAQL